LNVQPPKPVCGVVNMCEKLMDGVIMLFGVLKERSYRFTQAHLCCLQCLYVIVPCCCIASVCCVDRFFGSNMYKPNLVCKN